MIGKNIVNGVSSLVTSEKERSEKEYERFFHSAHEGYAIMKEEVEEAMHDTAGCERLMNDLWECVKKNNNGTAVMAAREIYRRASFLAMESIQVAAMAEKFVDSYPTWTGKE